MHTLKRSVLIGIPTIWLALSLAGPARADGLSAEDAQALAKFLLTQPLVEKAIAFHDALVAAHDVNAVLALERALGTEGSLGEAAHALEGNGTAARALKAARLSARDYLLTVVSVIQAQVAMQMQDVQKGPPTKESGLNPKNLDFARSHDALLKKLEASQDRLRDAFVPASAH